MRIIEGGRDDGNNNNYGSGGRASESPSAHHNQHHHSAVVNWQQFHNFLLQRMTAKTAEDRLRYSKRYACVLANTTNANDLLQLSPNKRIHAMKALSCLAKFTGCSAQWLQIRRRYNLTWTTGTEKIDAFARFFDDSKNLDTMLQWLREAIRVLPEQYSRFLLFCTLTGLRGSEAIESVRLLNDTVPYQYYNPEQQILQH